MTEPSIDKMWNAVADLRKKSAAEKPLTMGDRLEALKTSNNPEDWHVFYELVEGYRRTSSTFFKNERIQSAVTELINTLIAKGDSTSLSHVDKLENYFHLAS